MNESMEDVLTWFLSWQEGMVEFQGLLKVFVIQGTNLAIRDVRTSDPYVTATIGHQVRFFRFYASYEWLH